jgi:hypothetical protein
MIKMKNIVRRAGETLVCFGMFILLWSEEGLAKAKSEFCRYIDEIKKM